MPSKITVLLILSIFFAWVSFSHGAATKRKPPFTLRVYAEGSEQGDPSVSIPMTPLNTQQKGYIQTMPLLTEHDVVAAYPFVVPYEGGNQGGSYFRLNTHGVNALHRFSMEKQGTLLTVIVNGRHVTDVLVDKPASDGLFVISSGLTLEELTALSQNFPIIGKEKMKK
ncbi:MAG: hypothetical protein A3F67_06540 [Verrucomicrobia bacterium RIFCSPHIGHO2_12_FULL_41_10]|nr:MAG: hypothetical protein A3F67_06540 [Verrucomicrobia bacterium RIFCSPHIGHO2_12_FULL_41_10]HLB34283.1 hypothetical protein [Chthoniobacterales bacterium]